MKLITMINHILPSTTLMMLLTLFSSSSGFSPISLPSTNDFSQQYHHIRSQKNTRHNHVVHMTSYNDDNYFLIPPNEDSDKDRTNTNYDNKSNDLEHRRKDWIERSLQYYSTVMREDQRRIYGQISPEDKTYHNDSMEKIHLATKHYFALRLVKTGKLNHAETLYRRIIGELLAEEEEEGGRCDHAKLAVSTLLLALLLQRRGDYSGTRSVFSNFFMKVVEDGEEGKECDCSAKVLQAYALFEMKRGHSIKSLKIVKKAVKLDKKLAPVLKWKQFRETMEQIDEQVEKSSSTIKIQKCVAQ